MKPPPMTQSNPLPNSPEAFPRNPDIYIYVAEKHGCQSAGHVCLEATRNNGLDPGDHLVESLDKEPESQRAREFPKVMR